MSCLGQQFASFTGGSSFWVQLGSWPLLRSSGLEPKSSLDVLAQGSLGWSGCHFFAASFWAVWDSKCCSFSIRKDSNSRICESRHHPNTCMHACHGWKVQTFFTGLFSIDVLSAWHIPPGRELSWRIQNSGAVLLTKVISRRSTFCSAAFWLTLWQAKLWWQFQQISIQQYPSVIHSWEQSLRNQRAQNNNVYWWWLGGHQWRAD